MDHWSPTLDPPNLTTALLSAYPADLQPYLELPARPVLEAPALSASSSPSFLLGAYLYTHLLNPLYLLKKLGGKGPQPLPTLLLEHPSLYCHCLAVALSVPPQ